MVVLAKLKGRAEFTDNLRRVFVKPFEIEVVWRYGLDELWTEGG